MGKRKSSTRKPTGPKRREPLSTTFQCLFCNHDSSVVVKLDRKAGKGSLECKVCARDFDTEINALSAAIDVYSDWVDACDAVKKDAAAREAGAVGGGGAGGGYADEDDYE